MRKSWKMNKLIKKLFVSLTLLVFCELLLILLQSIRGTNSRFDSIRVYIYPRLYYYLSASLVYIDRLDSRMDSLLVPRIRFTTVSQEFMIVPRLLLLSLKRVVLDALVH